MIEQPIIKKKRPSQNYVDNKKLHEAFKVYKKNPEKGLGNYIGKCIQDIAANLATMPKFNGYSYIDEMKSDGIENVLMYVHNFDPEKYDNPFAYITKIVYYAFLRRIAKEKKEQYIKYKMTASYGLYNSLAAGDSVEVFDNLNEFIETFETKKKEKDAKKVKKINKKGLEHYVDEGDLTVTFHNNHGAYDNHQSGNTHTASCTYDILLPNNEVVMVSTGEIKAFCKAHELNWNSLRTEKKVKGYSIVTARPLE